MAAVASESDATTCVIGSSGGTGILSDGVHARLVKIQTQISKDRSVDKLVVHQNEAPASRAVADFPETAGEAVAGESTATSPADARKHQIMWLTPETCSIRLGEFNELVVERTSGEIDGTVHPSLRRRDLTPRTLTNALPDESSEVAPSDKEQARPQLRGFVECDVQTDRGREQFTMRWTQSQAQDFGERGKLIIDPEDNRYVIPEVDGLPKPDRLKFRQHIYW